jgi:hypothetical protein
MSDTFQKLITVHHRRAPTTVLVHNYLTRIHARARRDGLDRSVKMVSSSVLQ